MALLTVQKISLGLNAAGTYLGLTPALVAAASLGDQFINRDNRTFLVLKTAGTGSTVTIDSKVKCNQGHEHDAAITLGSTAEIWVGPFSPIEFSDGSTDLVSITYSSVATLTVGVFSISADGRP